MDTKPTDLVKGLEIELLGSDTRSSARRLDELLADEFLEIGASGILYTKQDVVKILPGETRAKFTILAFQAKEITADTILAIYLVEKEFPENPLRTLSHRSSLWQRRNGGWQMIFHQGTAVGENFSKTAEEWQG